jgi:DNA-binding PadR family transcriptional regulator
MKGTYLGEFEELVLLSVAVLDGQAYGVSIADVIEQQANRSVTISTVHNVLYRLEKKGFVESYLGGATKERGGRNKRLFKISAEGQETLSYAKDLRNRMWGLMPQLKG